MGVICLASGSRGGEHTDPITPIASRRSHFHLPHSLCLLILCLKCAVSQWHLSAASFPLEKNLQSLVYMWRAGEAGGARLPLISCSTVSIFNPALPFSSLLISPIPFSSQVHLAFIQEFSSALELLGLYLKTSPLSKSSRNLLILPAVSCSRGFTAEERRRVTIFRPLVQKGSI